MLRFHPAFIIQEVGVCLVSPCLHNTGGRSVLRFHPAFIIQGGESVLKLMLVETKVLEEI